MMQLFRSNWVWAWMAAPLLCACSSRPVKTIENLKSVVASEQNAEVRYLAFAAQAKEEGFGNVSNLFKAIARSEEIHVDHQRMFLKQYGEEVGVATDSVPAVGRTDENLKTSIRVEEYEAKTAFPIFVAMADAEGAGEIGLFLRRIEMVAVRHADFCRKALDKLETEGSDWNVANSWSVCPDCGCPYRTASLAEACDLCQAPASSFILFQ